jgi:hypothetical protein
MRATKKTQEKPTKEEREEKEEKKSVYDDKKYRLHSHPFFSLNASASASASAASSLCLFDYWCKRKGPLQIAHVCVSEAVG